MEQKEIIEKIIKKQNNLTSAQKMTFDGNALTLSLNDKKNKIMLILSVVFIIVGVYFIYNYYAITGQISQELWHWGLIALGGFAIFNRTKIANQKTIIDTQNKIIKQMVGNEVKNSIAFADATDFFIDSIKMRGGGFGIQSAVYVTNNKGKILLGVLAEKLPFINNTLAFFDETDDYFDVRIIDHLGEMQAIMNGENTDDKEWFLDGWYLKRRARVVWFANSLANTNPDNVDKTWKSVMLYPKTEPYLPMRVVFLNEYFFNTKKWDYFTEHQEDIKPYPFISSFLNTFNPNKDTDMQKQIAIFLNELQNSEVFLEEYGAKAYTQIMLWVIARRVKDENKDKFLEVVESYYEGQESNPKYEEIMKAMNE